MSLADALWPSVAPISERSDIGLCCDDVTNNLSGGGRKWAAIIHDLRSSMFVKSIPSVRAVACLGPAISGIETFIRSSDYVFDYHYRDLPPLLRHRV